MSRETLTETDIRLLLENFYGRIRQDQELGPLFNDIVEDWNEHLGRIEEFWSSIMLTTGRYKGNPVAIHLLHSKRIRQGMFPRWISIWVETTDELLPKDVALQMQAKARRIAERLSTVIHGSPSMERPEPEAKEPVDTAPYRVSPVFSETSTPAALQRGHSTGPGVWGIIRVAAGEVRYFPDSALATHHTTLTNKCLGLIRPQQRHHLELLGPVNFQVEFYNREPSVSTAV